MSGFGNPPMVDIGGAECTVSGSVELNDCEHHNHEHNHSDAVENINIYLPSWTGWAKLWRPDSISYTVKVTRGEDGKTETVSIQMKKDD